MTVLLAMLRTSPRSDLRKTGIGLALAASLVLAMPVHAQAGRGPEIIADVSEKVIDAVVNIKATQKVTQSAQQQPQNRGVPMPQLPPGSPFEDFFNDFFRRNGPGAPGQPPQGQGPQGQGPQGQNPRATSLGSGFVIDPSGLVVTNNHVVGEASDIKVVLTDGTELAAEIVGKDAKTDLALLRIKPEKPLKAVKFGDSDKLRIGEWVIAIGNPFGFGGSVSAGIVSAKQRNIRSGPYDSFIQTDAAINKGNSGGPLFNLDGDVVGINTAIVSPSGGSIGIGFSVPASLAVPVIDQLRQFGETRRGWLGVSLQDIDEEMADALKIGKARGALVIAVDEKGPAKAAGIDREDVIIRFDGRDLRKSNDLPRLVAQTPIGKEVEVVVLRGGKEVSKRVTLGRLNEKAPQVAANSSRTESGNTQNSTKIAGLEVAVLTADLRRQFGIKETVDGVVILRVDPGSAAAERRLQAGDVVLEVQGNKVSSHTDFAKRVEAIKTEGKKRVLLYVSGKPDGAQRYVPLPLE